MLLSLAIHINSDREVTGQNEGLESFQEQLDLLALPKSDIIHLLVHLLFLTSVQRIKV